MFRRDEQLKSWATQMLELIGGVDTVTGPLLNPIYVNLTGIPKRRPHNQR